MLQEYEEKAAEDKKRYEAENAKWLAEGGAEAIKAQKKTAKAAKKQILALRSILKHYSKPSKTPSIASLTDKADDYLRL